MKTRFSIKFSWLRLGTLSKQPKHRRKKKLPTIVSAFHPFSCILFNWFISTPKTKRSSEREEIVLCRAIIHHFCARWKTWKRLCHSVNKWKLKIRKCCLELGDGALSIRLTHSCRFPFFLFLFLLFWFWLPQLVDMAHIRFQLPSDH